MSSKWTANVGFVSFENADQFSFIHSISISKFSYHGIYAFNMKRMRKEQISVPLL